MTPMAFPIGAPEMIIILVIVLVLFGGARLAGLGKSTGRAIKEFKEETKGLGDKDKTEDVVDAEVVNQPAQPQQTPPPAVGGAPQQPQQQNAPVDQQQSGGSSTASTQSYGSSTQPTEARRDA